MGKPISGERLSGGPNKGTCQGRGLGPVPAEAAHRGGPGQARGLMPHVPGDRGRSGGSDRRSHLSLALVSPSDLWTYEGYGWTLLKGAQSAGTGPGSRWVLRAGPVCLKWPFRPQPSPSWTLVASQCLHPIRHTSHRPQGWRVVSQRRLPRSPENGFSHHPSLVCP